MTLTAASVCCRLKDGTQRRCLRPCSLRADLSGRGLQTFRHIEDRGRGETGPADPGVAVDAARRPSVIDQWPSSSTSLTSPNPRRPVRAQSPVYVLCLDQSTAGMLHRTSRIHEPSLCRLGLVVLRPPPTPLAPEGAKGTLSCQECCHNRSTCLQAAGSQQELGAISRRPARPHKQSGIASTELCAKCQRSLGGVKVTSSDALHRYPHSAERSGTSQSRNNWYKHAVLDCSTIGAKANPSNLD